MAAPTTSAATPASESAPDPIAATARWLIALSAVLMALILGLLVYFSLVPPDGNFRIGFGAEIIPLLVAMALNNHSQWGYDNAGKIVRWGVVIATVGVPWNLGFWLFGPDEIASIGPVGAGVCLVASVFLWRARAHYRAIPDDVEWSRKGRGIPLWVAFPIVAYVAIAFGLIMRLFASL